MKTVSAEKVQAKFPAYLRAAAKGPVVVTRNAKPVALLISLKNADEIERWAMSNCPKLRKLLDASLAAIEAGKGIPHDRFWKEIEEMRKTGRKARRSH